MEAIQTLWPPPFPQRCIHSDWLGVNHSSAQHPQTAPPWKKAIAMLGAEQALVNTGKGHTNFSIK